MQLQFPIEVKGQTVYFVAERIQTTATTEKFRVHLKWLSKSILIQNNRPVLVASGSRQPIKWKLKEGELKGTHLLNVIYLKLSAALKEVPVVKPPKVLSLFEAWR